MPAVSLTREQWPSALAYLSRTWTETFLVLAPSSTRPTSKCPANVHILSNARRLLHGVRIIGSTLWDASANPREHEDAARYLAFEMLDRTPAILLTAVSPLHAGSLATVDMEGTLFWVVGPGPCRGASARFQRSSQTLRFGSEI